jgi:hypothetical protein
LKNKNWERENETKREGEFFLKTWKKERENERELD